MNRRAFTIGSLFAPLAALWGKREEPEPRYFSTQHDALGVTPLVREPWALHAAEWLHLRLQWLGVEPSLFLMGDEDIEKVRQHIREVTGRAELTTGFPVHVNRIPVQEHPVECGTVMACDRHGYIVASVDAHGIFHNYREPFRPADFMETYDGPGRSLFSESPRPWQRPRTGGRG